MLILTSYLELENDRWTVETSFDLSLAFCFLSRILASLNESAFSWYPKGAQHLPRHCSCIH